ncbi:MAG: ComF family protein [Planctomycetes bacterium]|nr:ComF family protein [Planctomycetota bacterium]
MTTSRWLRALRATRETLLDLVLPSFCQRCGPAVDDDALPGLCEACLSELTFDPPGPRCPVCAAPLVHRLTARDRQGRTRCLDCRRKRPRHRQVLAVGPFQGPLAELIIRLKYGGERILGQSLGELLAETWRQQAPDLGPWSALVLPIPLSTERRAERGFNQSDLIARPLAARLGLRLDTAALQRQGQGPAQTGRNRHARLAGVSGRFLTTSSRVWGRSIVLVDDVMTTGATLRAATRSLFAGGALAVSWAVVARTPSPR